MKFKTGYENRRARVEMLPLIDVVFLLLVFFIYAMLSMVLHHGLDVELPRAGAARLDARDYLDITLTADNRILVGEAEATLDEVAGRVRSALQDMAPDTPVFIEGDRAADLGLAIELLDLLQRAGIDKVSFSCKQEA